MLRRRVPSRLLHWVPTTLENGPSNECYILLVSAVLMSGYGGRIGGHIIPRFQLLAVTPKRSALSLTAPIPDIEAFEERAAIAQYDGGLTLDEAEDLAAQDQGFGSAADYWHWLATYVANRGFT